MRILCFGTVKMSARWIFFFLICTTIIYETHSMYNAAYSNWKQTGETKLQNKLMQRIDRLENRLKNLTDEVSINKCLLRVR